MSRLIPASWARSGPRLLLARAGLRPVLTALLAIALGLPAVAPSPFAAAMASPVLIAEDLTPGTPGAGSVAVIPPRPLVFSSEAVSANGAGSYTVGRSDPGSFSEPANLYMPGAELTLTEVGEARQDANRLRIDDRQYEGGAGLPFTIGCTAVANYSVKVISNLKLEGATGEHQGVIDLEVWPGGHLTLEYRGSATIMVSGDNLNTWIGSTGAFKTTAVRGMFVGLPAGGVYWMHLTQEVGGPGSRSRLQLAISSDLQPWVWC